MAVKNYRDLSKDKYTLEPNSTTTINFMGASPNHYEITNGGTSPLYLGVSMMPTENFFDKKIPSGSSVLYVDPYGHEEVYIYNPSNEPVNIIMVSFYADFDTTTLAMSNVFQDFNTIQLNGEFDAKGDMKLKLKNIEESTSAIKGYVNSKKDPVYNKVSKLMKASFSSKLISGLNLYETTITATPGYTLSNNVYDYDNNVMKPIYNVSNIAQVLEYALLLPYDSTDSIKVESYPEFESTINNYKIKKITFYTTEAIQTVADNYFTLYKEKDIINYSNLLNSITDYLKSIDNNTDILTHNKCSSLKIFNYRSTDDDTFEEANYVTKLIANDKEIFTPYYMDIDNNFLEKISSNFIEEMGIYRYLCITTNDEDLYCSPTDIDEILLNFKIKEIWIYSTESLEPDSCKYFIMNKESEETDLTLIETKMQHIQDSLGNLESLSKPDIINKMYGFLDEENYTNMNNSGISEQLYFKNTLNLPEPDDVTKIGYLIYIPTGYKVDVISIYRTTGDTKEFVDVTDYTLRFNSTRGNLFHRTTIGEWNNGNKDKYYFNTKVFDSFTIDPNKLQNQDMVFVTYKKIG